MFARKRYQWDIQCEQFSQTSSQNFFRALKELSYYFYPDEQVQKFPNLLHGHSHGSEDESIYEHDPTHGQTADFHLHYDVVHPEQAKFHI